MYGELAYNLSCAYIVFLVDLCTTPKLIVYQMDWRYMGHAIACKDQRLSSTYVMSLHNAS